MSLTRPLSKPKNTRSLKDSLDVADGSPEICDGLRKALGRAQPEKLIEALQANHRLVQAANSKEFQIYDQSYLWLERKTLPERQYPSLENLQRRLERVAKCCTVWTDGQPSYVCQQPVICAVCAQAKADAVRDIYLKFAYARLTRQGPFMAHHIIIHAGSALPRELTAKNIELSEHIRGIRRYIHDKNKNDRRTGHTVLYDFPLHDDFYHCSARKHGRQHNFLPHFHVVVVHRPRNFKTSRVGYCFGNQCEERGLIFRHTMERVSDVDPTSDYKKSAVGLSNLGYYTSMPLKAEQLTEPERLTILLTLPPRMRMIRRKQTGSKIVPNYWGTARPNEDSFRFDPESSGFKTRSSR